MRLSKRLLRPQEPLTRKQVSFTILHAIYTGLTGVFVLLGENIVIQVIPIQKALLTSRIASVKNLNYLLAGCQVQQHNTSIGVLKPLVVRYLDEQLLENLVPLQDILFSMRPLLSCDALYLSRIESLASDTRCFIFELFSAAGSEY